jgi:hypothetical protein
MVWATEDSKFDSNYGQEISLFFTGSRQTLGAHPASYLMGTKGMFTRMQSGGSVKLITHLRLVPRLTIHGAIPPLPHIFMA